MSARSSSSSSSTQMPSEDDSPYSNASHSRHNGTSSLENGVKLHPAASLHGSETSQRGSLDLPQPAQKTAPVQVLVNNMTPDKPRLHLDTQQDDSIDLYQVEAIWEARDAGDAHMDYESEEEQDSELSQEEDQQRLSYKEALGQYRRSRKALLLSALTAYASSPSVDDFHTRSRQETPENDNASNFGLSPASDSYLNSTAAESIDTGDAPYRAHDAVFREDSPAGSRLKSTWPRSSGSFTDERETPMLEPAAYLGDSMPPSTSSESLASQSFDGLETALHASEPPTPRGRETLFLPPDEPHHSETQTAIPSLDAIPEKRSLEAAPRLQGSEGPRQAGLGQASSAELQTRDEDAVALPVTPRSKVRRLSQVSRGRRSSDDMQSLLKTPSSSIPDKGQDNKIDDAQAPKHDQPATCSQSPHKTPFSLWDYLQEEVHATDFDSTQEIKWERVTNFIAIPFWMEKIILFGFAVCLDSFLYTFTILPLRSGVAFWRWSSNLVTWILDGEKRYLHSSHKCDLLKCLLIVLSSYILSKITDASKMYHSVRGQDVVKLSVIFNVLEIADRLCCSFGQDLLDSLFSRTTLARRKNGRQPYMRPLGFFVLSLAYILAHTLVLFYQLVTLNVAINSYDNALLTLLLSNQFVEIKGSVFKKFEKENVFQMTCADIVERFQLTLMLSAIGLRNLFELSGGAAEVATSPLPTSFTVFPSLSLLETVLTPLCIVLVSECIVDWLKHAFITKFNHIRPAVYGRFMDVLCRDLVVGGPSQRSRKHTFVDQSPIVSRRLGFAALPLACLLIRLIGQIIGMIGDMSHFDECTMPDPVKNPGLVGTAARKLGAVDINSATIRALDLFVRGSAWALTLIIAWAFLVALKLLLGTNLVSFASYRYATMHQREAEEALNSRERAPIGVDKDEQSYDKKLTQLIDRNEDNAIQIMLDGRHVAKASKDHSGQPKEKAGSLMDVSRYTMVRSRIW